VSQNNVRDTDMTPYIYSPEHIGKALTTERLGGICHFNMCGLGETLIPEQTIDIARELLKNGHYVMIVTNALLTNRINRFCEFPAEYRERLGFKCSFHYLELKQKDLMRRFFDNIETIRHNGMSFSLEMTPTDEAEPYIDDIKKTCMEQVGALCHLTIPRNMNTDGLELLSKHSFEEFVEIWSSFDSELFRFKAGLWGEKRCEFCYAGEWSGLLNVGNGVMTQCYGECLEQNIFRNLNKKIKWLPIGRHCDMPHCYNSHSLLALGNIPSIMGNYSLERDRIDVRDGSHWLTESMREFLSHRLEHSNPIKTTEEEKLSEKERDRMMKKGAAKRHLKSIIKGVIKY